jgi:hypothetical protein
MSNTQSYKTHRRLVPAFHIGVLLSLLANFVWSVYQLSHGITGSAVMGLILSVALRRCRLAAIPNPAGAGSSHPPRDAASVA